MSKATQTDAMGSIQRGIKRTLDFVMSALGLILLSPIFIIISVLMKFQGNGPIFFRQIRIGYKGKPFVILKFRTISKKTEKNTPQLIAKQVAKVLPHLRNSFVNTTLMNYHNYGTYWWVICR